MTNEEWKAAIADIDEGRASGATVSRCVSHLADLEIRVERREVTTPGTWLVAGVTRIQYVPTWQDHEGAAYASEGEAIEAARDGSRALGLDAE